MFSRKSWAEAFVNSVVTTGGDVDDALNTLTALASWAASQQGASFGSAAAEKLEPLIRKAIPAAQETAMRFFLLMAKKNKIRHIDAVIGEIKNIFDEKGGIIKVSVEYAFPPEKEFESHISEAIKKRTGASAVELAGLVNPELIGGYRLRLGDEIIDASVRSQLRKMETCFAAGDGVNLW